MSFVDVLMHPSVVYAILLFCLFSIAIEFLSAKIALIVEQARLVAWMTEHIFYPLLRALAIIGFVLLAYPTLYGITDSVPLSSLLAIAQFSTLINIVYLLPFALPLLPTLGNHQALVLPLQGIAASSLLFHWLTLKLDLTTTIYWPNISTIIFIIVASLASHKMALWTSSHFSAQLATRIHFVNANKLLYNSVVGLFQAPVILIYSVYIGKQIH